MTRYRHIASQHQHTCAHTSWLCALQQTLRHTNRGTAGGGGSGPGQPADDGRRQRSRERRVPVVFLSAAEGPVPLPAGEQKRGIKSDLLFCTECRARLLPYQNRIGTSAGSWLRRSETRPIYAARKVDHLTGGSSYVLLRAKTTGIGCGNLAGWARLPSGCGNRSVISIAASFPLSCRVVSHTSSNLATGDAGPSPPSGPSFLRPPPRSSQRPIGP